MSPSASARSRSNRGGEAGASAPGSSAPSTLGYPDEVIHDIAGEPFQVDENPPGSDADTQGYPDEISDEEFYSCDEAGAGASPSHYVDASEYDDGPVDFNTLLNELYLAFPSETSETLAADPDPTEVYHISGPWLSGQYFYMDCITGECYLREAVASDALSKQDEKTFAKEMWEADHKELESFVREKVFKKIWHQDATTRPIDAVWVRRWKKDPSTGKYTIKSRLCIRGFLDPQKSLVSTRSTTATRLSQRLLLSISALMGFEIESWDVGVAFLKGFSFKQMEEAFRKRGVKAPRRKVYLSPPDNVWEHFRHMKGCPYAVKQGTEHFWLLELLKAMYGLNDAPLAWQLCLIEFIISTLVGKQSVFDECFFFWFDAQCNLLAIATAHVDDNGMGSTPDWLDESYGKFQRRFGSCCCCCCAVCRCCVLLLFVLSQ